MTADPHIYCLEQVTDYSQFERFSSDLMMLEGYEQIEPLGGSKDKGRDAIHVSRTEPSEVTIFAYSVRKDWRKKLDEDAETISKNGHKCSRLVFICNAKFSTTDRDTAVRDIKDQYGWELDLYGVERLRPLVALKYPQLIKNHTSIFTPALFGGTSKAPITDYEELYPMLQKDLLLSEIPKEIIKNFQTFIDVVNTQLDSDWLHIKTQYFPSLWKFGVCVFAATESYSVFQIYAIRKGSNAPLLIATKEQPGIIQANRQKSTIQELFQMEPMFQQFSSDFQKDPIKYANEFILRLAHRAIEERIFELPGKLVCEEQIFCFLDKHGSRLGFEIGDQVDLIVFKNALTESLTNQYEEALHLLSRDGIKIESSEVIFIPDSSINSAYVFLPEGIVPQIFVVNDFVIALKQTLWCVESLLSKEYTSTRRPYKVFGPEPLWTQDGFQLDLYMENLRLILGNALFEYRAFLEKNSLLRFGAHRFNLAVSTIYVPQIHSVSGQQRLTLNVFELNNILQQLPAISVLDESRIRFEPGNRKMLVDGNEYDRVSGYHGFVVPFLQGGTPLQNFLYDMLERDVNRFYKDQ